MSASLLLLCNPVLCCLDSSVFVLQPFSQYVPPLMAANGSCACLCINQGAVNLPFNRRGSRAGNYFWISNCADEKKSEKEKQQQGGGITCSLQPSPEKTIRTLWWWALILFLSIMSNQKNRCVYFEKIPPVSVRHISPAADSPASMKWWRITKYGLMI